MRMQRLPINMMWSFYVVMAVPLVIPTPSATVAEMLSAHYRRRGGDNVELNGLVNKVVKVPNKWECANSCMKNIYCMSFNMGRLNDGTSDYNCVHNVDTMEESGMTFSTRDGYRYYEPTEKEPLSPGVTAAAFDEVRVDLYLVYKGYLFLFPDLSQRPVMSPSAYYSLDGYDVTGLLVRPGAVTNQGLYTAYLGNGTLFNGTLDMITYTWTFSTAVNITVNHGPLAPDFIDDVVRINGTLYLIYNNIVYETDSGEQVIASYHMRNQAASNPFSGGPLRITAVSALEYPSAFFFKGTRYYQYNYLLKKVYHGGVLIDES